MTIFLVLIALLIAAIAAAKFAPAYSDWELIYIPAGILALACLVVCAATIPLQRMETNSKIAQFEAIRASRGTAIEIEAAAWRTKAAEANAWLASARYYNSTAFDLWIPDEVETLNPIE